MSNVDLATEFTNLIIAQRGFSANAKVITTSLWPSMSRSFGHFSCIR